MKKAILYVIVFALIQIAITLGIQTLWRQVTGNPDVTLMMLITMTTLSNVVIIAVFSLTRWSCVSSDYLRTRPWTVLFFSSLAAIGAILPSSWLQEQLPSLPNTLGVEFDMLVRDRFGYIVVGLLAPVAEELVFRGAVLKSLLTMKQNHWLPIAISALLFALIHANPAQMPHAFAVGMFLGWMYYRTGSILPSIVYHWVNNTTAYVIYNLMPNPDAPIITLYGGNERTLMLAIFFSMCLLVPSIFQLNIHMKKR